MSSGALDANRVEPKKEEGEQAAPHVPPAEPAEPTEQKGVKRKAGDMDGADATAAPEAEKQDPKPSEPAAGDAAAKDDKVDGVGDGKPGPSPDRFRMGGEPREPRLRSPGDRAFCDGLGLKA